MSRAKKRLHDYFNALLLAIEIITEEIKSNGIEIIVVSIVLLFCLGIPLTLTTIQIIRS